jgi:D-alanyl-lipoteichoic acid acyltransferase DltB (MBOAT superfamily)
MLFNSGVFLKFFAAFLLLYWLVRNNLIARNAVIVAGSYLFYGWWNVKFLGLLLFSSLFDYTVGLALERLSRPRQRKALLYASIVCNLSILGFFKYYNFFAHSLTELLTRLGVAVHPHLLVVILPVGISFYTFQSMSYAIDVYRREIPATRNLLHFLAFVSFFPQLVAGPIQRAAHLLPQFDSTLGISRAMLEEGLWLVLWGMFKKVVLADNLAPLVEMVYHNATFAGPTVVLGTIAFGLQIYCDFSGYSDIARGTARILGFDIVFNFNLPYVATNLREFWRRWHISLSTWLRDYLYVSLGGNRRGQARMYLSLFLTMLLGGLWHGAAWNFVLWGLWHAIGLILQRSPIDPFSKLNAPLRKLASWLLTLSFVFYGWLLFRATSLEQILSMTRALATFSMAPWLHSYVLNLLVFAAPLVLMEAWQYRRRNLLVALTLPLWAKFALQGTLLLAILLFWEKEHLSFIYFQF